MRFDFNTIGNVAVGLLLGGVLLWAVVSLHQDHRFIWDEQVPFDREVKAALNPQQPPQAPSTTVPKIP